MQAKRFMKLLRQVAHLTSRQRARLLETLRPAIGMDRACAVIGQVSAPCRCPACGAQRPCRHGYDRGLQRYRCRDCGKTFNPLTGTPLARLRYRAKWLDCLDKMLEARSVRATAKAVGIHRNTAFRWRHRFLQRTKDDRPKCLAGIAEADELFILESQKGSRQLDRPARKRGGAASRRGISRELDCVLVARDRTGATVDFVTGRGAVTKWQLHRHLGPVLDREVLLVTDSHGAYRAFARETGISHEAVNLRAGERVRGAIHVQNVNAYHQRFRQWLARFHGVASRYLPNIHGAGVTLGNERDLRVEDDG